MPHFAPPPPPPPAPASSPSRPPDLASRGLALYSSAFNLVSAVFFALTHHFALTDFQHTIKSLRLLTQCLTSVIAIKLTLARAPERVTPRQLVRLAKASRLLARLTGHPFDFAPWNALTPAELDRLSPLPVPAGSRPGAATPGSSAFAGCGTIRALGLLPAPGATLAQLCEKLLLLAPPDFRFSAPEPDSAVPPSQSAAPDSAAVPPAQAQASGAKAVVSDPCMDRHLIDGILTSILSAYPSSTCPAPP